MSERPTPVDANPGLSPDTDMGAHPGVDSGMDPGINPDLLDAAAVGYDPVAEAEAATAAAGAEDPAVVEGAEQSRIAGLARGAAGMVIEAARWMAPAAGDALQQRTGFDAYDFVGGEQPPLTEDQRFTSGVLQFAGQRIAERAVEHLASRQGA